MSRNSLIPGADYSPRYQLAARTRLEWRLLMVSVLAQGGRRRFCSQCGETFIHGADGKIVHEVYANIPEPTQVPRSATALAIATAVALSGCATLMGPAPRSVQNLNDGLEVGFQVLHAADTAMTYHGPASDKCYEEGDQLTRRIIGATPTRNQVIGWGVGYGLLHYGVTKWLNETGHDYLATGWELLTIEGTGNALAKGFRVGVRIGAPNKDTGCHYDGGNTRP